jgi:hypothetical protein
MDHLEAHLQRQIEHSRDFFWHRLRWAAVKRLLPAGPFELVDVGAGAGLLGEYLAEERPDVTYRFVEPIPGLAAHLEQRFGAEANRNGQAHHPGAQVLALLDVLEHQEDDHRFLEELLATMDQGARLIITVPALMRLWSAWDERLGHYKRYDKPKLRAAAAGLPAEIERLDYLFPEMIPPALMRKRRERIGEEGDAEFPDLPPAVNRTLLGVGRVSLLGRRVWPAGTSLLAVLRRR